MEILVGADPEVFIRNPNSGEPVSAYGLIPGTKAEPVISPTGMGATQVDGMALEFNIRPESDITGFGKNIRTMLNELKELVPGYNLDISPSVIFPDGYVQSQPAYAQSLGCDPDYCGWTGEENPRPDASMNMRTGAGHIHIGWTQDVDIYDKDHFDLCCQLAQHLDYTLGMYSLLWDKDSRRRTMYGKAGAFRPKPYGIEYRTLSNAWLRDVRLTFFVFNGAQEGCKSFFDGSFMPVAMWGDKARTIINNSVTDWMDDEPEIFDPNAKITAIASYLKNMERKVA